MDHPPAAAIFRFLALLPLVIGGISVLGTFLLVGGLTEVTGVSQIVEFLIALVGLGVKPGAVYYWLQAGDLPYRKRPTGAVCIPFSTEIEARLRARPAVSRHINRTQNKATGGAV